MTILLSWKPRAMSSSIALLKLAFWKTRPLFAYRIVSAQTVNTG
jgi:hypothetical protein